MRMRLLCLAMVLVCMAVSSSGCLALAVGAGAAGTVAYMRGDLDAQEPYDIDTVYAATRKSLDELDLPVLEGKTDKDALSATIVARDADDKRVTVKLKTLVENATRISVRVGTFGNEVKERLIYNQIRENLKAAADSPVQTATEPEKTAAPAPAAPTETPAKPQDSAQTPPGPEPAPPSASQASPPGPA